MIYYIELDIRKGKFNTWSKKYGFKKCDYLTDCTNFIENHINEIEYIRFDLGFHSGMMIHFCKHKDLEYDKNLKIDPQSEKEFVDICEYLERSRDLKYLYNQIF